MALHIFLQIMDVTNALIFMDPAPKFITASNLLPIVQCIKPSSTFEAAVLYRQLIALEGHLRLYEQALSASDFVVTTIRGFQAKMAELQNPTNDLATVYAHFANAGMLALLTQHSTNPELQIALVAVELGFCINACSHSRVKPTDDEFRFLTCCIVKVCVCVNAALATPNAVSELTFAYYHSAWIKAQEAFYFLAEGTATKQISRRQRENQRERKQVETKEAEPNVEVVVAPPPTEQEENPNPNVQAETTDVVVEPPPPCSDAVNDQEGQGNQSVNKPANSLMESPAALLSDVVAESGPKKPQDPKPSSVVSSRPKQPTPRNVATTYAKGNVQVTTKAKLKSKSNGKVKPTTSASAEWMVISNGKALPTAFKDDKDLLFTAPSTTTNIATPSSATSNPSPTGREPKPSSKTRKHPQRKKAKAEPRTLATTTATDDIDSILSEHYQAVDAMPADPAPPPRKVHTITVALSSTEMNLRNIALERLEGWITNADAILHKRLPPRPSQNISSPLCLSQLSEDVVAIKAKIICSPYLIPTPEIMKPIIPIIGALAALKAHVRGIKQEFWDELFVLFFCSDLNAALTMLASVVLPFLPHAESFVTMQILAPLAKYFARASCHESRKTLCLTLTCTYVCGYQQEGCVNEFCMFKHARIFDKILYQSKRGN